MRALEKSGLIKNINIIVLEKDLFMFVSKRLFLQSDSWRIKRGKLVTNETEVLCKSE